MAEEQKKCPPAGSPKWMATFADLMSLLLVLFVLLLTFSELNVIKYKQIAGAMRTAFGITQQDKLQGVVEVDGQIFREAISQTSPTSLPIPTTTLEIENTTEEEEFDLDPQATPEEQASDVENEVARIIAEEAAEQGVEVEKNGNEVRIRFPSEIAFGSGSANIGDSFAELLNKLTDVITKAQSDVLVSGHTDDIPLGGGGLYRSNWELSAARASSVVHHFLDNTELPQERLRIRGFGDSRPLVPNDSPENRAKNRRVEITLVLGDENAGNAPQVKERIQNLFGPSEQSLELGN